MRDLLAKLDRLQQSTTFKVVASIVVLVATLATFILYSVSVAGEAGNLPFQQVPKEVEDAAAAADAAAAGERG